jgi:predicted RNase H-like nuclease (RuvC/YqgF family)
MLTREQQQAYDWAINQKFRSVAAVYAGLLALACRDLQAENERLTAQIRLDAEARAMSDPSITSYVAELRKENDKLKEQNAGYRDANFDILTMCKDRDKENDRLTKIVTNFEESQNRLREQYCGAVDERDRLRAKLDEIKSLCEYALLGCNTGVPADEILAILDEPSKPGRVE